MTATQFTGGSFKHVDPSNYNTGKQGAEVTIHWTVRDGADLAEQTRIGEQARVEAIRLAMGAEKPPYPTPAAGAMSTTVMSAPAASPVTNAVPMPVASPAPTPEPVPTPPVAPVQMPTSSAPLNAPGPTAAPAADTSAPPATTPSPSLGSALGEVTDAQLRDAAMHHQARILAAAPKDGVSQEIAGRKISDLIAQFVTPPRSLYTLDQARRSEFLERIAAL